MIIPRVENLIFDKKNSKDEIWMLNYQNISLDHKIIKVFLKHQLNLTNLMQLMLNIHLKSDHT